MTFKDGELVMNLSEESSVTRPAVTIRERLLSTYLKFYLMTKRVLEKYYSIDKEIADWKNKKDELLRSGETRYKIKIEELGLDKKNLELIKKIRQKSNEVTIAEIDQDGFLRSYFGPIKSLQTVSQKDFLSRKRFNLQLVCLDGYVGVKKDYNGNKVSFLNEIKSLHILGQAGCNVPTILNIDFDNLVMISAYIFGKVLRTELAKQGATVLDRNVNDNQEFKYLNRKERHLKRIKEGKRFLFKVIDNQFVNELHDELKKIHSNGFIYDDLKYGNIIIEKFSGKPYLIDFEESRQYHKLGKKSFMMLCDKDIEQFNLHFF